MKNIKGLKEYITSRFDNVGSFQIDDLNQDNYILHLFTKDNAVAPGISIRKEEYKIGKVNLGKRIELL